MGGTPQTGGSTTTGGMTGTGGMAGVGGVVMEGCGSGVIEAAEVCDDGNVEDGDGCAADCSAIEVGFVCPDVGQRCVPELACGDPALMAGQPCDPSRSDAVDIVGPDGFTYPNWRWSGVEGGIPEVTGPVFAVPAPGTEADIEAAIAMAGAQGGGVVELAAGVYEIREPLKIVHDHVVLRGAGQGQTELRFTYRLNRGDVRWADFEDGQEAFLETVFEVHAYGVDLDRVEVSVDGSAPQVWFTAPADNHLYSTHRVGQNMRTAFPAITDGGTHTVTATAHWEDGSSASSSRTFTFRAMYQYPERQRRYTQTTAAINVAGDIWTRRGGLRWPLHQRARRGDRSIVVQHDEGVTVELPNDDVLRLSGNTSDAWDLFYDNTGSPNMSISQYLVVDRVTPAQTSDLTEPLPMGKAASVIHIKRPLRHDYTPGTMGIDAMNALVEGSYFPITGVGIESLTLVQTENTNDPGYDDEIFADGITMSTARNCWVRDVSIITAGRNPITFSGLNIEVRDVFFDSSWWTMTGQGTAYVSMSTTTDSLMENVIGLTLRHAPNAQRSANGSVIRRGIFLADAQYHFNWAHENLFEDLVVDARPVLNPNRSDDHYNGSYGWGIYAQNGHNDRHGPGGGPRNVVYGSDFVSPKSGLYLGGTGNQFMLMHNRFRVFEDWPAIQINDQGLSIKPDEVLCLSLIHISEPTRPY